MKTFLKICGKCGKVQARNHNCECKHSNQKVLNVAQNQCVDCGFVIGKKPINKKEWEEAIENELKSAI